MVLLVIGLVILVFSFIGGYLSKTLKADNQDEAGQKIGAASTVGKIIGLIATIIGFFTATVITVPAGQAAIVMRFGAVDGYFSPGIHMMTPYVNTISMTETRTQKETAACNAASKDLQIVSTKIALNYHINAATVAKLYKNVGPDYKARIIDPAVQESLKQVTAQYTAEELVKRRADVKSKIETEITQRLLTYGITVEPLGLSITDFDFSPEFNTAIEQKQVAQQTAEKQKYVLQQAVLEKQTEITKAEGQAQASKIRALALKSQGGGRVIAEKWIDRWDGKLPIVSGSSNMMLNVGDLLKQNEPAATE